MAHDEIKKKDALSFNTAQIIYGYKDLSLSQLSFEQLDLCNTHCINFDIVERKVESSITNLKHTILCLKFTFTDGSTLLHQLSHSLHDSGDDDLPY